MKTTRFLPLLAGAAWLPLAAVSSAELPQPALTSAGPDVAGAGLSRFQVGAPPSAGGGSSSTAISTSVANGKGTITITIEKDGKTETRTLNLNSDEPAKLAEKLLDEIKAHPDAAPAQPKKKVTYLGVMLAEAAGPAVGGGGFGNAGGGGGGGGGRGGDGGGAAPGTGLPAGTGLAITGVSGGSPAEKAGLQGGDVLAKLDEQILVNPSQFTTLIRNKKEGDTIKLAFVRNGEARNLEVTLATREEEEPAAFGYGSGAQGGSGKFLFRPGKGFPGGGSADGLQEGRVLRLEKDGKVLEEWLDDGRRPQSAVPPSPGSSSTPPAPLGPGMTDKLKNLKLHEALPQWEKTLREAAEIRDNAAEQWKKQLSEWRDQWTKSQEKTAAEYRHAMEKLGEEIHKANDAALKAQEDARRAIEAWKEKRSDEKDPPPAALPPSEEKKDPDQPKKA